MKHASTVPKSFTACLSCVEKVKFSKAFRKHPWRHISIIYTLLVSKHRVPFLQLQCGGVGAGCAVCMNTLNDIAHTFGWRSFFTEPKFTTAFRLIKYVKTFEVIIRCHPWRVVCSIDTCICGKIRIKRMIVNHRQNNINWLFSLIALPIVAILWPAFIRAGGSLRKIFVTTLVSI